MIRDTIIERDEIGRLLEQSGLPADPKNVIGRMYKFQSYNLSTYTLIGTIIAMEISDRGLMLQVSNHAYLGNTLLYLTFDGYQCSAVVSRLKYGTFNKHDTGMTVDEKERYQETGNSHLFYSGRLILL